MTWRTVPSYGVLCGSCPVSGTYGVSRTARTTPSFLSVVQLAVLIGTSKPPARQELAKPQLSIPQCVQFCQFRLRSDCNPSVTRIMNLSGELVDVPFPFGPMAFPPLPANVLIALLM